MFLWEVRLCHVWENTDGGWDALCFAVMAALLEEGLHIHMHLISTELILKYTYDLTNTIDTSSPNRTLYPTPALPREQLEPSTNHPSFTPGLSM